LEIALEKYQGQCVSFHCEDPKLLEEHTTAPTHEAKRPREAEISAVDFALMLIEKYNLSGKICHASTTEAIEKISAAKARGVSVSVEVTPHHLYFDETMFTDTNHLSLQVNPPIRQSKENRLALIAALKRGDIDYLATDHAPHTIEEKEKGISGMPHLDTYGAFTTWLMKEHGFTPSDIARVCAENPAQFIRPFVTERHGAIEAGYSASFSIIDTNRSTKILKENLKTKCHWSPFEGVTFPGRVATTIVKGKIYAN
jgi:dihydroorotase